MFVFFYITIYKRSKIDCVFNKTSPIQRTTPKKYGLNGNDLKKLNERFFFDAFLKQQNSLNCTATKSRSKQ